MPVLRLVTMRGGIPSIAPSRSLTTAEADYICQLVNDAGEAERERARLERYIAELESAGLTDLLKKADTPSDIQRAAALSIEAEVVRRENERLRELVREAIPFVAPLFEHFGGNEYAEWLENARAVVGEKT